MTTFALVHGAYGSGALWAPLAGELEARGHRVVAPDLPVEDRDAAFSDYARVVEAALGATDGDVMVVGHSMGGATAALVAAAKPEREVVYVAALLPRPGGRLADVFADESPILPALQAAEFRGEDGLRHVRPDLAADLLFQDAEPADRALAHTLRGQAVTPYFEVCPLEALPSGRYVVCREDRIVSPDWGRDAARRLLGVDAVELGGGHSPAVTRPAELADLLGA